MVEHRPHGYPILLRLAGQPCAIVGGGKVGERKTMGLLEAGALVTVVSPTLTPALAALAADGAIRVMLESYSSGMFGALRPRLVFAATSSPEVNRQVAQEARLVGALIDVVDSADAGDFSSMTAFQRGPLTVAVSTGGASPTLAAHVRGRLEAAVGPEYGTLAGWLAELRPQARAQLPSESSRRALWQAVLDSAALDLLRQGDEAAARGVIQNLFTEAVSKGQKE
jgi:precorrin-2 dehydrogenase/sirohydrochlorin ferrochelatase